MEISYTERAGDRREPQTKTLRRNERWFEGRVSCWAVVLGAISLAMPEMTAPLWMTATMDDLDKEGNEITGADEIED